MENRFLNRRLAIMQEEGVIFRTSCNVGVDLPVDEMRRQFDAVVLAGGAAAARALKAPGRQLAGVHYAMEYLPLQNRRNQGDAIPDDRFITAKDKHVIIIGGGEPSAACLRPAQRQG